MRELAHVEKILDIQPISDALNIEICTIKGWKCVVEKNKFKIGEKVIYFEIDSLLPEKPEFEFMRERKFRVKTAKFRGQISQGLVMPLSILPKGEWIEGQDLTMALGVKKFDPQAEQEQKLLNEQLRQSNNKIHKYFSRYKWYRSLFTSKKKTGFPAFINKTDEPRINNMPFVLNKKEDLTYIVTEKLDGSSITMYLIRNKGVSKFWKPYIFGVCSRNLELTKPDNSSYWTIARQYDIENVLKSMIGDKQYIVLQGEVIGEGIQKNKYKIKGYDFYAFNLIYPNEKIDSVNAEYILLQHNIKFVPILDVEFKLKPNMDEMVEYARGKSVLYPVDREGVVIRNYEKQISFKVISPDFLLKNDE